jgi:hypothetical protein
MLSGAARDGAALDPADVSGGFIREASGEQVAR